MSGEGPACDVLRLLRLCQLASPALPIGAYAYSQGLEYAVHAGWINNERATSDWLHGLLHRCVGTLDLPLLLRLLRAWTSADLRDVQHWNAQLIACRETAELRAEELHLGRALALVLVDLEVPDSRPWLSASAEPSLAAMFALAAAHWDIAAEHVLAAYVWSWMENQVLAAVKLVPLGQAAGQRLLYRLAAAVPAVVARAQGLGDEAISASSISQLLASGLHETQYSRLFRS